MKFSKIIAAVASAALATCMFVAPAFAQDVTIGDGSKAGQIEITNASKGETYTVYKIFDATVNANGKVAYKLMSGKDTAPSGFEVSNKNYITSAPSTLTDGQKAELKKYGILVSTAVSDGTPLYFKGLDDGYYYITTTLGTAVTITNATHTVVVNDKNTADPVVPENAKKASATNKTIGENVDYQISLTAVNYTAANTKVTNYKFVDVSSDVKVDLNTVAVTVDGATITNFEKSYTNNTLTVTIPWTDAEGAHLYKSNASVVVSYTAEILAVDAATNTATVYYNTDQMIGVDDATVNNYAFTLQKTDGTNDLTGAQFTLAKADGTLIAFKIVNGEYIVANSNDTGTTTTIDAGTVVIDGLGNGTYTLTEIKAPDGYNQLTAPVTVTINGDSAENFKVVNQAGAELPTTGGMGTTIIYIIGALMVAGAVVVLIARRRVRE